jgi:hypothetical protein
VWGCILSPRQGSIFFKFSGMESVRTWQKSFFYVRNRGPGFHQSTGVHS